MISPLIRYSVGMIRTFDEAREAVRMEVGPLIGDAVLRVDVRGHEDEAGYLVEWGVEYPPLRGIATVLPGAATFVDRRTGAVQITARREEADRISRMSQVYA